MAAIPQGAEHTAAPTEQKAVVTLYWLEKSRSHRILWLLEELNVKYELKTFKRMPDLLAPPELAKIHPLGKAPVMTVKGEGAPEPLVLAESGAMIEYLIDNFGPQMKPAKYVQGHEGQIGWETPSWIRDRYFLHFGEGSVMPYLLIGVIARNIKSGAPLLVKPVTNAIADKINSALLAPTFAKTLAFLEDQCATAPDGGEYLCGKQLTGADIMMGFPIDAMKSRHGLTKEKYPKLYAYLEKIEGREAYKRAVQKIIDVEGSFSMDI